MSRNLIAALAVLVLTLPLHGCARAKIKALSKKVDAVQTAADELKSRANALEARLQQVENLVSNQQDLSARIIGKWSGVTIRVDASGTIRESGGAGVTFNSDGTVSDARLPGVEGASRYRVLNSRSILFSLRGGRQQIASSAALEGNRLSFLLGTSPPTAVALTRQ